jgi:uncharacterized iron-regulated membrane protein
MKVIQLKKLYLLHSWVGIVTGILLFIVAFTGALAVFAKPELKYWAHPALQTETTLDYQGIENVVQHHAQAVPPAYREEVVVFLPGARNYEHLTVLFENHETQQGELLTFDHELTLLEQHKGKVSDLFQIRQTDFADFIANFHADLHLGRPVGLLLTGLMGLTMLASVITGFIIHRQKLKQLFTFRKVAAWDIKLADAHRLFGVWGLLFHGVIAFTGAFLGLATVLLLPAAAYVTFNGDQEKLVETFTTIPTPVLSQEVAPTKLANILSNQTTLQPDVRIEVITVMGLNDSEGVVYLNATNSPDVARQLIQYQAATGERLDQFGQFEKLGGVSSPVLDLMFPLHFGNFAGILSKLLWTVLGLASALIPLSGLMMWVNKKARQQHATFSTTTLNRLNRLIIGSCGGLVMACTLLLPTQLLVNHMAFANHFTVFSAVFFGAWLSYVIITFIVKCTSHVIQFLNYGCGLILLFSAIAHWILSPKIDILSVAGVINMVLVLFGVTILALTYRQTKPLSSQSITTEG